MYPVIGSMAQHISAVAVEITVHERFGRSLPFPIQIQLPHLQFEHQYLHEALDGNVVGALQRPAGFLPAYGSTAFFHVH